MSSSPDPVVVLGARIKEGRPSRMLEARLSTALTLAHSRPAAPVVVTGKGESGVMARWLIAHGLPAPRIVEEPEATSTNENLENSRKLFPDAARLVVVTNGFHVARTKVWAAHLGVPITVVAAPTPKKSRLKNYAREVIAVPHSAARVVWRKLARRWFGR
ncbi:YdcF family protein [Corynebacterium appendicis]|uniref:YdcF family protein n=1 Tax=Corynebacterium appendicis TaxID=163202 RepID=UPI0009FFD914|nr:YdcF family protein [Corynebacterium appendicis]